VPSTPSWLYAMRTWAGVHARRLVYSGLSLCLIALFTSAAIPPPTITLWFGRSNSSILFRAAAARGFRRLGLVGVRSKCIVDHAFVSTDRHLTFGPLIVAAGFLPAHATALCDGPQVAVTLCRSSLGGEARHGREAPGINGFPDYADHALADKQGGPCTNVVCASERQLVSSGQIAKTRN
jgi:hypothetical protein